MSELDSVSATQAADMLRSCCGSSRWVSAMVALRPFGSRAAVVAGASRMWRGLSQGDWQEAFRHHPRIGESASAEAQTTRGEAWSAKEQAGIDRSGNEVRKLLADANGEYERKFGYVFIVNATGRTGDEMLELARARLTNNPEFELQVAAGEQEQIMLHRLRKLLDCDLEGRTAR